MKSAGMRAAAAVIACVLFFLVLQKRPVTVVARLGYLGAAKFALCRRLNKNGPQCGPSMVTSTTKSPLSPGGALPVQDYLRVREVAFSAACENCAVAEVTLASMVWTACLVVLASCS